MNDKLSLILLSYNKSQWLEKGIESCALEIDSSRYEILLMDNGSTENNIEIAQRFPNVKVIALGENLGAVPMIQKGIESATGDYLCLFSHEDPLKPKAIVQCFELIRCVTDLSAVGGWYNKISENGDYLETVHTKWDSKQIFMHNTMPGCFISRRSIYDKVMWRDVEVEGVKAYQDWDLWMQFANAGLRAFTLPIVSFSYRQHASNTEHAIRRHDAYRAKMWEMNGHEHRSY